MISQEEIIVMTKLALHEKKYGKIDKRRNTYFKWDYIYVKNTTTRFAVGIAGAIIIAWLVFTDVYIKEIIPVFDIELGDYLAKYIAMFALLILLYTGISTFIFNKEYEESQRRLQRYQKMLNELEHYQSLEQASEEDLHDTFESVTSGSGSIN